MKLKEAGEEMEDDDEESRGTSYLKFFPKHFGTLSTGRRSVSDA
jgi:hypothetical protein